MRDCRINSMPSCTLTGRAPWNRSSEPRVGGLANWRKPIQPHFESGICHAPIVRLMKPQRSPGYLKKKVVVITGASSGFGKGAARRFARAGTKLVLAARRERLLQEL